MKKLFWLLLFFLMGFSLYSFPGKPGQQQISDILQPVRLVAGRSDTLMVSDLFYAKTYLLTFPDNPHIKTKYDSATRQLILTPEANFEGMTLLPFKFARKIYHLPVICEIRQQHTFHYRPSGKPQKITVMGSFNNWNRNANPMQDEDGDGIYESTLAFDPGRYEYKFVVDGKELIDPQNPNKVSNPFGSYNSVLTIPPRHSDKAFLHLLGFEAGKRETRLKFMYERENQPGPIGHKNIIALLDNQLLPAKHLAISNNRVEVCLSGNQLQGERILRLAVTQNGQTTLMQHIRLEHGSPANGLSTPFSWADAIIYSIMIDRFHDGDPTNTRPIQDSRLPRKTNYQGGDLQGIFNKIEEGYFDSLGVNVLWISPVNDNTGKAEPEWPPPHRYFSAYHGYWPVQPRRVEERFGNLALLKRLIQKAHEHGLRVLLDFIANHVYIDHPFYRKHRNWFGVLDLPDGRKNIRFWDEFRLTTWFEPFLPSFDYLGSEQALQTMTDNAIWWLRQTGADGFRHDAVKHIPNKFWRLLTQKVKSQLEQPQGKKIFQIGETFGGYDLVKSYVNNGQLDAQFNFNLYYTARYVFLTPEASFAILSNELQKTFKVYGMNNLMGNIMDSHDQVRYMAYADGDLSLDSPNSAEIGWTHPPEVDNPQSYKKAQLYLAYLLTIPGVPTLDYGDEIGMTGAADPDNRRMMRFGEQLNMDERKMLQTVRKLVHLRREHPALRYGDFQTLWADKNCFAYLRSDLNERILITLNKSEIPQKILLKLPKFYRLHQAVNLFSKARIPIIHHQLSLKIPQSRWQIFKIE